MIWIPRVVVFVAMLLSLTDLQADYVDRGALALTALLCWVILAAADHVKGGR